MSHGAAGNRPAGAYARRAWRVVAICAAAAGLLFACQDSVAPPRPASFQVVSGNGQSGRVGEALAQRLTVRVVDAAGQGFPDIPLTFGTPDGGSLTPSTARTGADGTASATWTLGPRAASQRAIVTISTFIAPLTLGATARPGPAVTARIEGDSLLLGSLGDTVRAPVTFADRFGNPVPAAGASYASSDEAVATVGGDGLVTARAPGRALLQVRLDSAAGQAAVVVRQLASRLVLSPRDTTVRSFGDTAVLVARAYDGGGSAILPLPALAWTPRDTAVAALRGPGLAVARGNGSLWVVASVVGAASVADSARVSVAQVPVSLTLSPDSLLLDALGATGQLRVRALDARGNDYVGPVTLSSLDTTLVRVAPDGIVTALAAGATRVVAAAGSVTDTAVLLVRQLPARLVKVGGDGGEQTVHTTRQGLTVRVLDALGSGVEGVAVSWSTGSGSVAGSATTAADGTAGAAWTVGTTAGAVSAQAAAVVGAGSPVTFQLTAVADTAASGTSTVSADSSQLVADGSSTSRVMVRLRDAWGNPLTATSPRPVVRLSTSAGTLSAGGATAATVTAGDNGDGTFQALLTAPATVGTATLSATLNGRAVASTATVQLVAGSLHHFRIEAAGGGDIGAQLRDVPFDVRISARDASGNVVTGFTGTATLTSQPAGSLVAGGLTASFSAGVLDSHSVTLSATGPSRLTATRTGGSESGSTAVFDVQAPPTAQADTPSTGSAPGSAFHTALNVALAPGGATPGLLANDDPGFPLATVASFGAIQTNDGSGSGALGAAEGTVTGNAAGDVMTPLPGYPDGSLTVAADGRFSFTPPAGYTGPFRFAYRLSNALGSSDAQVTLNVGVRPSAAADSYPGTLLGNVTLNTATGTPYSVTANDAGDRLTLQLSGAATGGEVSLNADGTFVFRPDPGFTGTGAFSYTVANGFGTSSAAAVSLPVGASRIWFVDLAAASNGNGTQASPFRDVTDLAAVNDGAAGHPRNDDAIFLYRNASPYAGPLTLRNGQQLVGQDATVSLAQATGFTPAPHQLLPATEPADGTATMLAGGATTLTLNSGNAANTLRGFTLGASAGTALAGTSFGTLTVSDVAIATNLRALSLSSGTVSGAFSAVTSAGGAQNIILTNVGTTGTVPLGSGALSGATGSALRISGGSGSFSYAGSISATAGRAVYMTGKSGGAVTLSGAITASGTGPISLMNNTNTATTFSGDSIVLTPPAGQRAVSLTNNAASNTRFTGGRLVIATSNADGFFGDNGGGITVSGASNTVGATGAMAVHVDNDVVASVVSLTFLSVSASGGISGIMVRRLGEGGGITVTGDGSTPGSGGTIRNTIGGDVGAHDNPDGTGIWLFSVEHASFNDMNVHDHPNFALHGESVVDLTLDRMSITGTNGDNASRQEGAVVINDLYGTNSIRHSRIMGGAWDNLLVNNRMADVSLALSDDTIQDNAGATGNNGVTVIAAQTAHLTVTVDHSVLVGNRGAALSGAVTQTGILDLSVLSSAITASATHSAAVGINVSATDDAQLTFDLSDNQLGTNAGVRQPLLGTAIGITAYDRATASGFIRNNQVWQVGASGTGQGILLLANDLANLRANVDANTVDNVGTDYGILAGAEGAVSGVPPAGTATLDLGLTDNLVNVLATGRGSLRVQATDNNRVCAAIAGNGSSTTGTGYSGLAVVQTAPATFSIAGLVPPVIGYLSAGNPGVTDGVNAVGAFAAVPAGSCNIP